MGEFVDADAPELPILARLAGHSFGFELFSAELFCSPYDHCLFCTRRIAEGSGGDFETKGYVTLTAIEALEAPLWLQWDWVCVACFGRYRDEAKWTVLDRGLDAAAFGAFRKNRDESRRRMEDEDVCDVDRYALQVTWTPEEFVWIARARGVALSESEASLWLWRNRRGIAGRMEAVAYAYICERMEREVRLDRGAGPNATTPGSVFLDLWNRCLELRDAGAQQGYVGKHLEDLCRANHLGYWRCSEPPPKPAGRCLFVGIAEWVRAEVVLLDRLSDRWKSRAAETPLIYVFGIAECQGLEEIKRIVPDVERRAVQSPLVAVWENGECRLTVGGYAALQWFERFLDG